MFGPLSLHNLRAYRGIKNCVTRRPLFITLNDLCYTSNFLWLWADYFKGRPLFIRSTEVSLALSLSTEWWYCIIPAWLKYQVLSVMSIIINELGLSLSSLPLFCAPETVISCRNNSMVDSLVIRSIMCLRVGLWVFGSYTPSPSELVWLISCIRYHRLSRSWTALL